MKATQLLQKQHAKVRTLFRKLESGRSDPAPLLEELANDLAAHMAIEQEIFYPAMKDVDEKLVMESFEEHALAEVALKRLLSSDPSDESFRARVKAAKDLVEHHVQEEEEEMFPKAEKKLGEQRLEELGKRMKARFDEVVEAGFEATVPKSLSRTSADVAKKSLARYAKRSAA